VSVGGGFTVHRMTSSLGHKTGRSSHANKDRGNALELLASVSVRVRKKKCIHNIKHRHKYYIHNIQNISRLTGMHAKGKRPRAKTKIIRFYFFSLLYAENKKKTKTLYNNTTFSLFLFFFFFLLFLIVIIFIVVLTIRGRIFFFFFFLKKF